MFSNWAVVPLMLALGLGAAVVLFDLRLEDFMLP